MSYVFKGQVKIADVQKAFDDLVESINSKINVYNEVVIKGENVDYTKGSSTLAPYGYTLSVGGLKAVMDELAGTTIGCNVYRVGSSNVLISDGIHFNNDHTVDRLPAGDLSSNNPYNFYNILYGNASVDRQADTFHFSHGMQFYDAQIGSNAYWGIRDTVMSQDFTYKCNGGLLFPYKYGQTITLPAGCTYVMLVTKNDDGSFRNLLRISPADARGTVNWRIMRYTPDRLAEFRTWNNLQYKSWYSYASLLASTYGYTEIPAPSSQDEFTCCIRPKRVREEWGEEGDGFEVYFSIDGSKFRHSEKRLQDDDYSYMTPDKDMYILVLNSDLRASSIRVHNTPVDLDFNTITSRADFESRFPSLITYENLGKGFNIYWNRASKSYTTEVPADGYLVKNANMNRDIPYLNTGNFLATNVKNYNIYAGGNLNDGERNPDIGGERFVIPDVQKNNGNVIVYLLGRILGWKGNWGASTSMQAWSYARLFLPKSVQDPIKYNNENLGRTKFVTSKRVRK